MKTCLTFLTSIAILGLFIGCGSSSSSSGQTAQGTPPSATTRPIPADSILAKVKMGEEMDQVFAEIGRPTNLGDPYQTGKAWIPFHYGGGDDMRRAAHYKGVGIVTFGNDSAYTSGWSVVDVTYDPNDSGY
jgi:hypothetical protein